MFGFSPFAATAFSDISGKQSVDVTLVGFQLDVIDDGVGVAAGGSISVDPNDDVGVGQIGTVQVVTIFKVPVTGVEANASLGSVLIKATSTTALTSVSAEGVIGTATTAVNKIVPVSGVVASGTVGSVIVSGKAATTVTGLQASALLNSVDARVIKNVLVSGVTATGQVGTLTTVANCNVFPIGVQAAARVKSTLVWSVINDNQTPNWVQIPT